MGPFLGVFEELSTILAPKWPLVTLGTILRGQKSVKLLKNPSKGPILCFSRIKKIMSRTCRISSSLIVKLYSTQRKQTKNVQIVDENCRQLDENLGSLYYSISIGTIFIEWVRTMGICIHTCSQALMPLEEEIFAIKGTNWM